MSKMKILKIQICSAQNVGKVWINRKKTSRGPFGAIPGIFPMDRNNPKNVKQKCLFSLVGQWALFTWGWGNRYVCLSCPIWQACDHQNTGVKSQVLGTAVTLLDNSLKCKWLIQKIALAKDNDSWSSICYCFLDP